MLMLVVARVAMLGMAAMVVLLDSSRCMGMLGSQPLTTGKSPSVEVLGALGQDPMESKPTESSRGTLTRSLTGAATDSSTLTATLTTSTPMKASPASTMICPAQGARDRMESLAKTGSLDR